MKVLITGANGFIGRKTGEYFLQKGYEVYGWDRGNAEDSFLVESVDMLDRQLVEKKLEKEKPDIIIHCAGSADVGKSVQDPWSDYEGNVSITHHLLFAMHKTGLEKARFVFLSSASVYGNPKKLPISENEPLNPLSPYALHKQMCEQICYYFADNYSMNIKVARIFSAYGAGLKKQIFWDMYQKQKTTGRLDMFGTGDESRDYIHVMDVIQALYLLAVTDHNEIVFNVANGEEITIRKATEEFAEAAGVSSGNIFFNGIVREGDPLNWRADISRIRQLGYKKTVDLKEGLEDYIQWVLNQ